MSKTNGFQRFAQLPKSTYFGGKGSPGVAQKIINQIPKHQTFVSGFLGHCAVTRIKMPALYNMGFELDAKICEDWDEAVFPTDKLNRKNFTVYNQSFFDAINEHANLFYSISTFLYLDPTYPLETLSGQSDYDFNLTDLEHEKLLIEIKRLGCCIAISTYENDLYNEHLKNWRKVQFEASTRSGMRTETLYMNYPKPEPLNLHDTRFVGSDFRAREKSKRRIKTLMGKIEQLTPNEKAIFATEFEDTFPELRIQKTVMM
jgi:DNA adenine methylase